MPDEPTLGSTGQVHVSLTAAEQYADARRLGLEAARRELTMLLLGARRQATDPRGSSGTPLEGWRIRSRALRVDVGAHVSREGELAVVTHVHVRHYAPRSRG